MTGTNLRQALGANDNWMSFKRVTTNATRATSPKKAGLAALVFGGGRGVAGSVDPAPRGAKLFVERRTAAASGSAPGVEGRRRRALPRRARARGHLPREDRRRRRSRGTRPLAHPDGLHERPRQTARTADTSARACTYRPSDVGAHRGRASSRRKSVRATGGVDLPPTHELHVDSEGRGRGRPPTGREDEGAHRALTAQSAGSSRSRRTGDRPVLCPGGPCATRRTCRPIGLAGPIGRLHLPALRTALPLVPSRLADRCAPGTGGVPARVRYPATALHGLPLSAGTAVSVARTRPPGRWAQAHIDRAAARRGRSSRLGSRRSCRSSLAPSGPVIGDSHDRAPCLAVVGHVTVTGPLTAPSAAPAKAGAADSAISSRSARPRSERGSVPWLLSSSKWPA